MLGRTQGLVTPPQLGDDRADDPRTRPGDPPSKGDGGDDAVSARRPKAPGPVPILHNGFPSFGGPQTRPSDPLGPLPTFDQPSDEGRGGDPSEVGDTSTPTQGSPRSPADPNLPDQVRTSPPVPVQIAPIVTTPPIRRPDPTPDRPNPPAARNPDPPTDEANPRRRPPAQVTLPGRFQTTGTEPQEAGFFASLGTPAKAGVFGVLALMFLTLADR